MKKGIASILFLLYFAFSTGVTISYHYCMDEFDSLQFGDQRTDICGKCGMHVDTMACCSDEVRTYKIEDDQQTSAIHFKFEVPAAVIHPAPTWNESFAPSTHPVFANNHSPPLSEQDSYLHNCVFRI